MERLSGNLLVPPWVRHEHMERYRFAASYVMGKTVVDFACGEGGGSRIFAAAGARSVQAFDGDPEAISRAHASGPSQARFELARRLREVHVPVLVLHGERDSMIPFELGRAVFDAANEPKQFSAIPGADHNDLHLAGGENYYQTLLQFARNVPQPKQL